MENHKENEAEILRNILDNDLGLDDEQIVMLIKDSLSKQKRNKEDNYSFGDKAADRIAKFAGSWTFIIIFVACLILWMFINIKMKDKAFDPYPFILLNLVLSCVAAIQAPLIMMSQNRQEEKDRQRAEDDYIVNLKTEIIIRDIHKHLNEIEEKLDQNNEIK
ncbi:DUF1003 domain-containing protein [Anaerococcus sp. mt242]|uniref:DUF1003 domain-containing protein n=1 Tax=unclassified Anaerococcus TaxID=2614126 RepID=UPI001932DA30|nr:DUF1003 domain-containing protein [Anaerococcus sp. mt242]MBM0046776.1 DUF1003 domain-containing protein [Anaerococcus sp. mt242]